VLNIALLSGCQTWPSRLKSVLSGPISASQILLLDPDVELSRLTAGDLLEARADWTDTGERNVRAALDDLLEQKSIALVDCQGPEDTDRATLNSQLLKLHQAVGVSILLHSNEGAKLPTSSGTVSLGGVMRERIPT
jgi:hypothetical protein